MVSAGGNTAIRLDGEAPRAALPLILQWKPPDEPLPVRAIWHPARARSAGSGDSRRALDPRRAHEAPPWLDSGAAGEPFDFCQRMRRLCADIVARSAELRHIDLSRLLFTVTQARSGRAHGLQARVTPLRFRDGALTRRRRQVLYQVQRYFVGAHEILYLVTFCLPRFLDLDFDEKLITLFHELFHISPAFDGDLRRHGGRYSLHSHSQRLYDQQMAALAREYVSNGADAQLHAFLRLNFGQLLHRHGSVVGVVVPRPKLVPIYSAE